MFGDGEQISQGFPGDSVSEKKSACNAGEVGLTPRLGRPPGGGHGNPLQYPAWKNPTERRGAWGAESRARQASDTSARGRHRVGGQGRTVPLPVKEEASPRSLLALKDFRSCCALGGSGIKGSERKHCSNPTGAWQPPGL